jgi:hypothetical protein
MNCCADLYVVEFQKRGLPHIHALTWLKEQTRDVTGNTIDRFVSAEIPDIRTDPLGYAVVEEFMIHGPCGEFNQGCPCMKDGICSKRYPKTFNEETVVDSLGFPVYRRRQDGRHVTNGGVKLDNRWVVPYNLALLKKFQGHLNVEWCNKSNLLKLADCSDSLVDFLKCLVSVLLTFSFQRGIFTCCIFICYCRILLLHLPVLIFS